MLCQPVVCKHNKLNILCSTFQLHYNSETSCQMFLDKLTSSVQTIATVTIYYRQKQIVPHRIPLWNQFQHVTASNLSPTDSGKKKNFSLMTSGCQIVANWSLGLCDWGHYYFVDIYNKNDITSTGASSNLILVTSSILLLPQKHHKTRIE